MEKYLFLREFHDSSKYEINYEQIRWKKIYYILVRQELVVMQ